MPTNAKEALKFFDWVFSANSDKMAMDLDYVPLPENVTNMIHESWKAKIKDSKGKQSGNKQRILIGRTLAFTATSSAG